MSNTTSSNSSPASFAENSVPTEAFSPNPAPTLFERFNRSRIATVAIFAVVAAAFYLMNFWTPIWTVDDIRYSFLHSENPTSQEKIASFTDLWISFKEHYLWLNGRLSDGIFTKIFLIGDKWIFDILNTIAACFTVFILGKICRKNDGCVRPNAAFWLLVFAIIWWTLPKFGTALWVAGSANYLWSMLFFALFFFEYERAATENFSLAQAVIAFAIAFIAGWMNEAFPIPFFVGTFFHALFFRKIPSKQNLFLLGGLALGFALIVASPGQLDRAGGLLDISKLLKQATATLASSLSSPGLLAVFALLVFLFFKARKANACCSREWKENALPLFCAIGGFVAITLISGDVAGPGRQYWGVWFFAVIAFLRISRAETNTPKFFKIGGIALVVAVVPAFIFSASRLIKLKNEVDELYATARTTPSGFVPLKAPFYAKVSNAHCPWATPVSCGNSAGLRRITGVKNEIFLVEETVARFLDDVRNFENFGEFKSFYTPTANYTIVKISSAEKSFDFKKWQLGIRFLTEKFSFIEKIKFKAFVAAGFDKKYTSAPVSEFFVFEKNGGIFVIMSSTRVRASFPCAVVKVDSVGSTE